MDERSSRPSGPGGTSISAQLSVRRGRAAIDFYKAAFGATEDYCVGGNGPDRRPLRSPLGEIGKPLIPWPPTH